ncbi:MAG: dTDP-4-dehydrorhamnose 3,5-epimerase [Rickettsiales bacterium]|nr:dTDP-4-dehydrorhamnose 3,5-epimerase [Rickettsiales bacterium]
MKFRRDNKINDVIYIEPDVFGDERGYFFEAYHEDKFKEQGLQFKVVQSNQSKSRQGVLRGLHLQKAPKEQAKLVRVLDGRIFDVAVDVRQDSATFGMWTGYELNSKQNNMLFIPGGFAHGLYVLSDSATVFYQCNHVYAPESELTLRYDDPELNIDWPFEGQPILSSKDKEGFSLRQLSNIID